MEFTYMVKIILTREEHTALYKLLTSHSEVAMREQHGLDDKDIKNISKIIVQLKAPDQIS